MIGKGIFVIDEKRGFRFGTYAGSIVEQSLGKKIQEVFSTMFDTVRNEKGEDIGRAQNANTIHYLLHYFHGGAVAYAKSKGLPIPNEVEVSDWIDEKGLDWATNVFYESIKGPNVEAPEAEKQGASNMESKIS